MDLSQLKVGESCNVVKVENSGHLKRRLFDMGITPGCEIFLKKLAPLGDPMQISLRGYELTMRAEDAKTILIDNVHEKKNETVEFPKKSNCNGSCAGCKGRGKC